MTQQYLIGELAVRLEHLEAVAARDAAGDVARLRLEVENAPPSTLGPAAARAMELADSICWQSLNHGDAGAFAQQAAVSADLWLFGVCARLLADS